MASGIGITVPLCIYTLLAIDELPRRLADGRASIRVLVGVDECVDPLEDRDVFAAGHAFGASGSVAVSRPGLGGTHEVVTSDIGSTLVTQI
ncbi:hypothetical protein [Natrialba swarupiae]|uniref:hypothetical protein n=1 Tax=Natrialba swarupiae TaxID=2448032 RepID=UPI00139123FB|nr:hypothetical protein [Natrialba swarupiae]